MRAVAVHYQDSAQSHTTDSRVVCKLHTSGRSFYREPEGRWAREDWSNFRVETNLLVPSLIAVEDFLFICTGICLIRSEEAYLLRILLVSVNMYIYRTTRSPMWWSAFGVKRAKFFLATYSLQAGSTATLPPFLSETATHAIELWTMNTDLEPFVGATYLHNRVLISGRLYYITIKDCLWIVPSSHSLHNLLLQLRHTIQDKMKCGERDIAYPLMMT